MHHQTEKVDTKDHEQDLDTTNTTTQQGTKIQQSKLNWKIVGHKRVIG